METGAFESLREACKYLESDIVKMSIKNMKKDLEATVIKDFEKILNEMVYSLIELEGITFGKTKEVFSEIRNKTKKVSSELRKLKKDNFATNENLVKIAKGLHIQAAISLKDLPVILEYKNFVSSGELEDIQQSILNTIFKAFKTTREITVLEEGVGDGERLLSFQKYADAPKIYTYGADKDVETCQEAKDNGVFKVAKGGIVKMTPHCFDVFLFFQKKFTFEDIGSFTAIEVFNFAEYFRKRKPMKNGGYIIFNLPYYRIPDFHKRLMALKVEGMYRVDDEAGNIIFICSFKKPDEISQKKDLKKALMIPESIPHYSEVQQFLINKGEVTPPEDINFKGAVIDARDHDVAFKDEMNPMDFIEGLFEPLEKTVELNEPLQEYKNGHLSAIAPTGITNGIYDTHFHKDMVEGDLMHPHLLSTKILRRDVASMVEEMRNGKLIPVISIKKSSELVMAKRTPDGKVTYLLAQINKEKSERAKEKKKKTREKAKSKK